MTPIYPDADAPAPVEPAAEAPAAQDKKAATPKAKKAAAPKGKKRLRIINWIRKRPRSMPSHPHFFKNVLEACTGIKERIG